MAFAFKLNKKDKELEKEFNRQMILDNSRRFIILLSAVFLINLFFIIAYLLNKFENKDYPFSAMIYIAAASIIFITALILLRKKSENNDMTLAISIVITFIHALMLALACYLTIRMYGNGNFSFSVFLILAFFVSISHLRWPYAYGTLLVALFIGLSIYVSNTFQVPGDFTTDSIFTFTLVILINLTSILSYRKYWQIFLKDKEVGRMNAKLTEMSEKDMLTGVYNRRKIYEKLREFIKHAQRYKNPFSVVLLDIDKFKRVNDTYGHITGDYVLKELTRVINANLRESDTLGRWGGEEFIIFLPNADVKAAFSFTERLREIVENHIFDEVGQVTFSAGICGCKPAYSIDNMIERADLALYQSKQTGRNKVSMFEVEKIS